MLLGSSPNAESYSPGSGNFSASTLGCSVLIGEAMVTTSSFAPALSACLASTRQRRWALSASISVRPLSVTVAKVSSPSNTSSRWSRASIAGVTASVRRNCQRVRPAHWIGASLMPLYGSGTRRAAIRSCWTLPGTLAGNHSDSLGCALAASASLGSMRTSQAPSSEIDWRASAQAGVARARSGRSASDRGFTCRPPSAPPSRPCRRGHSAET